MIPRRDTEDDTVIAVIVAEWPRDIFFGTLLSGLKLKI